MTLLEHVAWGRWEFRTIILAGKHKRTL